MRLGPDLRGTGLHNHQQRAFGRWPRHGKGLLRFWCVHYDQPSQLNNRTKSDFFFASVVVIGVSALRAPGSSLHQMCATGPPLVIPSPSPSSTSGPSSSSPSASSSSSASSSDTTPSITPPPSSPSAAGHKTKPVAAIAGGVVGGMVVVSLLFLGLFLWRKKNGQPQPSSEKTNIASPLPDAGSRLPTLTSGTASPYVPEQRTEQAHWQMRGKELVLTSTPVHQQDTGPSSMSGVGLSSSSGIGRGTSSDMGRGEHPPDYDFV
ncbi:hypothetical protein B0H19DRAFT_105042 [Mycena capillaripes]|nr:hypothetical protein B0H19DRAFT_105042 [Mycena capillaripes]